MPDALSRFTTALADHDCSVTRTDEAGFDAALADAVRGSVVGVPLAPPLALPEGARTDPTPAEMQAAVTGVTPAAFGVANTGTVAIRSTERGEEPISLYPERHVAVVREEDVEPGPDGAFDRLRGPLADDRDSVVFATGPSATGDMGALIQGVHGPSEVHVIVVEGGESGG